MSKDRSIEAQRARLLGKKSSSKTISDKYIKTEIINMKYGIQKKTVHHSAGLKPFYFSASVFMFVSFVSFFMMDTFQALMLGVASFIVCLVIFNQTFKKKIIQQTEKPLYNISQIFINYDSLIQDEIKDKMVSLKCLTEDLSVYKLSIEYQHYLQSTIQKDIPSLFFNYQKLQNSNSENTSNIKHKLLEQLNLIEIKLKEIKAEFTQIYENNIEIKSRVIKEKTQSL